MNDAAKNTHLDIVASYMNDNGISLDDLTKFQTGQEETKEEPEIRPSELEGVANQVAMSPEQLTAELAELKRRFNNLNAAHYNGNF